MADFKSWALQYVLADDEGSRQDATVKAANAIKTAPVKSTAVLNWIQSVNSWLSSASSGEDDLAGDDREGESEGSIIARAQALGFLADTLQLLDKDVLRTDQVKLLIAFFGRLFSLDHKAGITAAAKALHRLIASRAFKPDMGDMILQSVSSMKDDFRLQPPQTRLDIYLLITDLIAQPLVSSQLQHTHGRQGGFALDLLQLASHERDPQCLISWFEILQCLMKDFDLSEELGEEIFKAFSAYFPVSMRSAVNPAGVTVEDLKSSLRACFSAAHDLAHLTLPFLLGKLDHGDTITTAIKVDILRTLKQCLERYEHPSRSIVPFMAQVWNSLKYEVRNGEVEETIGCTLEIIRTLVSRLSGIPPATAEPDPFNQFTTLVLDDCLEDLSNPSYIKQAGLLLQAVISAHVRPFVAMIPKIMVALALQLREPKTNDHTRAALQFMTMLLDTRSHLVETFAAPETPTSEGLADFFELDSRIQEQFYTSYTCSWKDNNIEGADADNVAILKEAAKGLACLVTQPSQQGALLCDADRCEQTCALLSDRIVNIFQLSSAPDSGHSKELAIATVEALQRIVLAYADGYSSMLGRAIATLKNRDWGRTPSRASLLMLKTLLSRLSFIGCSAIPDQGHALRHLHLFCGTVLRLLFDLLDRRVSMEVSAITLSGLFTALLNFREACASKNLMDGRETLCLDWKSFVSSFARVHPGFPSTGVTPNTSCEVPSSQSGDTSTAGSIPRGYLECGLYLVVQLYQRATAIASDSPTRLELSADFIPGSSAAPEGDDMQLIEVQDAYLHRLAEMGTFVVRNMTDAELQSTRLAAETSTLFRLSDLPDTWLSSSNNGRTNVLSLGLLQGLRPTAMAPVYTSKAQEYLINDARTAEEFPERTQKVRDRIALILANKWIVKSPADQQRRSLWKAAVDAMGDLIDETPAGQTLRIERYSRIIALAAGAVARRDKDVVDLATKIWSIPESSGPLGEHMARCLEDLVSARDQLTPENHAIVQTLHQQWLYHHFVKPRLKLAYPFIQDAPGGMVVTVSILHVVKHLSFPIWEDDVGSIVRLSLASLSSAQNLGDIEASFKIIQLVLENKPDDLRDQLKAAIAGAVKTLGLGLETTNAPNPSQPEGIPARFVTSGSPARCRRLALMLLAKLPETFEHLLLLQHSARLTRVLMNASGDPVRDVRQCALIARRSWVKVKA